MARVEYETFNKDSHLFSVGFSMRLGEPKEAAQAEKETELAAIEVPVEEKEEAVNEVPVVLAAESYGEAPIAREPASQNMEELFLQLKRDLEPTSLFELNSAVLSNRLMGNLDELVYFLNRHPEVKVVITGHASDDGHEYLNENLSLLRAHGVKTYLQASGVADDRVIVRGRGHHFPRHQSSEDDFRARNRRIEYDFFIPKK